MLSRAPRTLASIGIVGITQVFTIILYQVVMVLLARALTPNDFGTYALCLVFINLATTTSMFGLDAAVIYRQSAVEEAFRTAATMRTAFAVVAATLFFLLSAPLARFLESDELIWAFRVASLTFVVSAIGFESSTRLSKSLRFRSLSITKITYQVVWSASALALAYLGWHFWSMLYAYFIGTAAMLLALWHFQPWKIRFEINSGVARELLRYGVFSMGSAILAFLVWNMDKIVIERYLDTSLLGIYWIAFTYGIVSPSIFTNVVNSVMFPTLSGLQDDKEALKIRYSLTLKYLAYVSIPIGVGLAATSNTFVTALFGSEWKQAAIPLSVFSIVGILSCLNSPAVNIFLSTGRARTMFAISLVVTVPFLMLAIPSVVYGGMTGMALLFLAMMIAVFFWGYSKVAGILSFQRIAELSMLAKPAISSLIMACVCLLLAGFFGTSLLSLVLQVAFGVAAYVACMTALTRNQFIREAKELVNGMLGKT